MNYKTALGTVLLWAAIFGLLVTVHPGIAQSLMLDREFASQEASLARVIGLMIAIVGWLYIFGGRFGGRPFVAATIVDRIVLVPLVLLPLIYHGVFPHTLLTFAILDPVLAGVAWWLLNRETRLSPANV